MPAKLSPSGEIIRSDYCVVENGRVVFASNDPGEVAAFVLGRGAGQICAVMKQIASV